MSLHYDFRLEIGNAMPSWYIPKSPSLDSAVRRLALLTSDHLLEYYDSEGVISAGNLEPIRHDLVQRNPQPRSRD